MKSHARAIDIVKHSDGARIECTVMDELVSEWYNNEEVTIDEILSLNKKAIDHLQALRIRLKTEKVVTGC